MDAIRTLQIRINSDSGRCRNLLCNAHRIVGGRESALHLRQLKIVQRDIVVEHSDAGAQLTPVVTERQVRRCQPRCNIKLPDDTFTIAAHADLYLKFTTQSHPVLPEETDFRVANFGGIRSFKMNRELQIVSSVADLERTPG